MKPRVRPSRSKPHKPDGTPASRIYLAPDDFATIYDVAPLYAAGINGTGQKIAIAGQIQVDLSDIEQFRSQFNLPANDPQMLLVPGRQIRGQRRRRAIWRNRIWIWNGPARWRATRPSSLFIPTT